MTSNTSSAGSDADTPANSSIQPGRVPSSSSSPSGLSSLLDEADEGERESSGEGLRSAATIGAAGTGLGFFASSLGDLISCRRGDGGLFEI